MSDAASASAAAPAAGAPAFQSTVLLTFEGAARAMAAAEAEAEANGWKVCVVVCDAGGQPLLMHRHTFAASSEIAAGKARAAVHFARPTGALEAMVNVDSGAGRTAMLSAPYVLMRGGAPIVVGDVVVGAVGVSGVRADQDEQVAMAGVNALDSA